MSAGFEHLKEIVSEYILQHKDSPYNNRRNKLRKIADVMFGMITPEARIKCDERIVSLSETKLTELKIKPTFNSFRSRLSPAVLEELVIFACSRSGMIIRHQLSEGMVIWVSESVTAIRCGSYDHLPFGSTALGERHEEFLESVKDYLFEVGRSEEVVIKKEIKKGASMSSEIRINLQAEHKVAIDAILSLSGSDSVDAINSQMDELLRDASIAKEESSTLANRLAAAMSAVSAPTAVSGTMDGALPDGEVVFKNACDVFHELASTYSGPMLNFKVPTFEWDGVHPDVPSVDVNYKFDMTALFRVLQGIVDGNNSYLYGHTGTGKSTLVEQVCAHLKYPLVRVNFDSEISRMDLIGRDTLVTVDGQTVSKFVDGVLPDALSRPCLLLCDEVDFVRPDVMYVFQRVLEGNGLLISEDGGRRVDANPWFRLIATANTVGQGDDTAMYQGARAQSMATLDRFENWVEMGYMKSTVETKWLKGVTDGLSSSNATLFIKYAKEHREAFTSGMIMQPLSPRGLRAMAKRFQTVLGLTGDQSESMREAFGATVLARCTQQDKIVLDGLYQRVYK